MTIEERLLFLMFLDYKGALKKWEKNHNEDKAFSKIESKHFHAFGGFNWRSSVEGGDYWRNLVTQWNKVNKVKEGGSITLPSLRYIIYHETISDIIEVGCQKITKEDALKIADFIYECFGE